MDWKDLSQVTKNTLEMCWGLNNDDPRSVVREIGVEFQVWQGIEKNCYAYYLFTEECYQEILAYQQHAPVFDVQREGNVVTCTGRFPFGQNGPMDQAAKDALVQGLVHVTDRWLRNRSTIGADHILRLERFKAMPTDSRSLRDELKSLEVWLQEVAKACVGDLKDAHIKLSEAFGQAYKTL